MLILSTEGVVGNVVRPKMCVQTLRRVSDATIRWSSRSFGEFKKTLCVANRDENKPIDPWWLEMPLILRMSAKMFNYGRVAEWNGPFWTTWNTGELTFLGPEIHEWPTQASLSQLPCPKNTKKALFWRKKKVAKSVWSCGLKCCWLSQQQSLPLPNCQKMAFKIRLILAQDASIESRSARTPPLRWERTSKKLPGAKKTKSGSKIGPNKCEQKP